MDSRIRKASMKRQRKIGSNIIQKCKTLTMLVLDLQMIWFLKQSVGCRTYKVWRSTNAFLLLMIVLLLLNAASSTASSTT